MSGPSVRQAITTSTRATALLATVLLTSCQHTATQDKYGRTLAYVATPSTTDVGLKLITDGYAAAWWPHSAPTPQRAHHYLTAQDTARNTHVGSWEHCTQIGRHKAPYRTP